MSDDTREPREVLAALLRALRERTGTVERFSEQVHMDKAKISRIQTGKQLPSDSDLAVWTEATGATDAEVAELRSLLDDARARHEDFRAKVRGGRPAYQRKIGELQRGARLHRHLHIGLLPGMVQTAPYARLMFTIDDNYDSGDADAATAARLERGQLLYDQNYRFEFLLDERCLRFIPGGDVVALRGQLDRLRSLIGLPNVWIGIVPLDHAPALVWHGFALYDQRDNDQGPIVVVELLTGETTVQAAEDVAIYQRRFDAFREGAVTGDEARALLDRIDAHLREQEQGG